MTEIEKAKFLKDVDMATIGSLCVDILLTVPKLPPETDKVERKAYMDQLAASPPDKKYWEAGGNCNLAIAGTRLGLRACILGHVGNNDYGHFLVDVLQNEGVRTVEMNQNSEAVIHAASNETHLCWVLVDPSQNHDFLSPADFDGETTFNPMTELSIPIIRTIESSKVIFCDGYVFDELLPDIMDSALQCAIDAGTTIFLDPGPRGKTLLTQSTPQQQRAFEQFLRLSDVLLLTSDEAESVTGIRNPVLAGQELIKKGERTKWVIIKMGSRGSILITKSSISCAPAFKVDVVDTVGCGDSYTAAVAFGYIHDMPEIDTLVLANAVGAATAIRTGAGRNVAAFDKVMAILKQPNVTDDDIFWDELFEENLKAKVTVLSGTSVNGNTTDGFHRIPVKDVVSQVLQKF